jgi:hypothetical protein
MNCLLGPIFFIRDQAPENFWAGVVLVAVLVPAMGVGFIRPFRVWRAVISILAALSWVAVGIIGQAIGA